METRFPPAYRKQWPLKQNGHWEKLCVRGSQAKTGPHKIQFNSGKICNPSRPIENIRRLEGCEWSGRTAAAENRSRPSVQARVAARRTATLVGETVLACLPFKVASGHAERAEGGPSNITVAPPSGTVLPRVYSATSKPKKYSCRKGHAPHHQGPSSGIVTVPLKSSDVPNFERSFWTVVLGRPGMSDTSRQRRVFRRAGPQSLRTPSAISAVGKEGNVLSERAVMACESEPRKSGAPSAKAIIKSCNLDYMVRRGWGATVSVPTTVSIETCRARSAWALGLNASIARVKTPADRIASFFEGIRFSFIGLGF